MAQMKTVVLFSCCFLALVVCNVNRLKYANKKSMLVVQNLFPVRNCIHQHDLNNSSKLKLSALLSLIYKIKMNLKELNSPKSIRSISVALITTRAQNMTMF